KDDLAGGGFRDAGEDFQQSGFARAIASDDSDDLAGFYIEGDITQSPEVLAVFVMPAARAIDPAVKFLAQRCGADGAKTVMLGNILDLDDGLHVGSATYATSMKVFSTRWKTRMPVMQTNRVVKRE